MENKAQENWDLIDDKSLEKYLKPRIRKSNLTYYFNMVLYLFFLLGGIIILNFNISGYKLNLAMSYFIYSMLFVNSCFLLFGVFLITYFYRLNKFNIDLLSLLNKQLRFISTFYEIWIIIIPYAILTFSFSFTILIDNQNGEFPVSNKLNVIGIHAIIYLILYGLNKLANYFQKRPILAFLEELKSDLTEKID